MWYVPAFFNHATMILYAELGMHLFVFFMSFLFTYLKWLTISGNNIVLDERKQHIVLDEASISLPLALLKYNQFTLDRKLEGTNDFGS